MTKSYQNYVNAGICPNCGSHPTELPHVLCQKCRQALKNRAARLKEQGICVGCGKQPTESERTRCSTCLQKEAQRNKQKRQSRITTNICIACGKQPARKELRTCNDCAEKESNRLKTRRDSFRNSSQCTTCGSPADDPKYTQCTQCRNKQNLDVKRSYWQAIVDKSCPDCKQPRDPESPSKRLCSKCYAKSRLRRIKSHSLSRYDGQLEAVIERDKGCVICGKPWRNSRSGVVCHHMDNNPQNNDFTNLVLLCRRCHTLVTNWVACSAKDTMLKFLLQHYPSKRD